MNSIYQRLFCFSSMKSQEANLFHIAGRVHRIIHSLPYSFPLQQLSFFPFVPPSSVLDLSLASQDTEQRRLREVRCPRVEPGEHNKPEKIGKNSLSDGRLSVWTTKQTRLENNQAGIFLTKQACLSSRSGQLGRTIFKGIREASTRELPGGSHTSRA